MVTHLPNARVLVLPHAGHRAQLEQPERFAARGAFLRQDLAGGLTWPLIARGEIVSF